MAKCIMVQGTMSGSGKSLLVTALCRIFTQDGYRVAPFKSQNMALNSYITNDGKEMGRAQVAQAQAACKEPDARMNPILLKPTSDVGSQVIVNGEVYGQYKAKDYFKMKKSLIPDILKAYNSLADENDIIVIEGAGSPAEINLKSDDIVNMGLAKLVDAPVILVGDIDPGGVFAQLYGTVGLLEDDERARIKGMVINKFRGDIDILKPGIKMIEEKTNLPVVGTIPYTNVDIDDEDSLSGRLNTTSHDRPIDIAIIRLPKISNFTDFAPLEEHPALGVRYVSRVSELGNPDMIIIPGSKSTMADLLWMRQNGLEAQIQKLCYMNTEYVANHIQPLILGVCGGYQMLGNRISDPKGAESGGDMKGMGLLPIDTVFASNKTQTRVTAAVNCASTVVDKKDIEKPIDNLIEKTIEITGYEIHMGKSSLSESEKANNNEIHPFSKLSDGRDDGLVYGNVYGTYLHGLFDNGELVKYFAEILMNRKGIDASQIEVMDRDKYRNEQYNILADVVRQNMDIDKLYEIMGIDR